MIKFKIKKYEKGIRILFFYKDYLKFHFAFGCDFKIFTVGIMAHQNLILFDFYPFWMALEW